MTKTKHNFSISPTLIDSFLWWERMQKPEDKFQEIINKINRVPFEFPEAAKKGVAFEDCVNLHLSGQVITEKDGFKFDGALIERIAGKLANNIGSQKWIERVVNFKHGAFRVGGFLDFNYADKTVDLKTCGSYKLGKYDGNSQHRAYGLIEPEKKEIIYLVTDFTNMYIEPYKNKPEYHEEFIYNTERFYDFTREHKELITDARIWGNS